MIDAYLHFTIRGLRYVKKSDKAWIIRKNSYLCVQIVQYELYYLTEYCGFVGSGMSSRNAHILSRSLRKEFEKSFVRGTSAKPEALRRKIK